MNARIISKTGVGVVIRELHETPARIERAAARGLKRGLLNIVAIAQKQFLSGPRPGKLDVRTTRLRNAMAHDVRIVPGRGVIGRVGNNVSYAAYHEFGFHGTIHVPAHTRAIQVFTLGGKATDPRRQLRDRNRVFIAFRSAKLRAARALGLKTIQGRVRAHDRRVDYEGKPFTRPAIVLGEPLLRREIVEALQKL